MSNDNIRVYSIEDKQYIENNIQNRKKNIYKDDIINLISQINNDIIGIYKRRKEIDGTGIFYSESKFVALFDEAYKSYLLGHYHSAIALCSITAERICYDYIEHSELSINKKEITLEAKKELYFLNYYRIVKFLYKEGLIDEKIHNVLLKINDTRNKFPIN